MKQQTGAEKKINKSSQLLSPEENQQVFNLLDRKCMSMCTAVVQLYVTDAPAHSHWVKRCTGALCFVKDNGRKSYYCRLYCLVRHELVWEQEMYDYVQIQKTRSYLLNFEGQDGIVALNFASDDEAENFYRISTSTTSNRIKKREERLRRTSTKKEPPPRPNVAPQVPQQPQQHNNTPTEDSGSVTLRRAMPVAPQQPQPMAQKAPPVSNFTAMSGGHRMKKTRGKITKEDIGNPTGFVHITHVGWSEQRGFDWTGEEVETLKPFLEKAGVSESQLKDRKTREFIYDFIQSNKVLDLVNPNSPPGMVKPPPPSVTGGRQQIAPPPVPTRQRSRNGARAAPPPPPQRQPQINQAPPKAPPPGRPPPISAPPPPGDAAAPAPPPPPPPPPMAPPPPPMMFPPQSDSSPSLPSGGGSSEPDARSALMDSIRAGTKLKTVDRSDAVSSGGDSRSDLLEEIRRGKGLKPASERELPSVQRSNSGAGADALADALRRALMERGRVIQSSDEDSNNSTDNDGEWDD